MMANHDSLVESFDYQLSLFKFIMVLQKLNYFVSFLKIIN